MSKFLGGGLFDGRPATKWSWGVFLFALVDAKIIYSGLRFIAAVLAVGGLIIISIVLGSLFQRERGKELVAEIRRLVKRD